MTALVRQVPMRTRREAAESRARWYVRIVACLFGAAAIGGLAIGPRSMKVFAESKVDIAQATVSKLAFEAYPEWRLRHPDVACPSSYALLEFMNLRRPMDPWGSPYDLHCDTSRAGIVVRSLGEDGELDTADDIWSANAD